MCDKLETNSAKGGRTLSKNLCTASISFRGVFGNRVICFIVVCKDEVIHVQICANVFGRLLGLRSSRNHVSLLDDASICGAVLTFSAYWC